MKLSFGCYVNRDGQFHKLEAISYFSRGDLAQWISSIRLDEVPQFIQSLMESEDYTIETNGAFRFPTPKKVDGSNLAGFQTAKGIQRSLAHVPDHYIGFENEGLLTCLIPQGALVGFLGTLCNAALSFDHADVQHLILQQPFDAWRESLLELKHKVDLQITTAAVLDQGIPTFQSNFSNRPWGLTEEFQCTFTCSEAWLPYLSAEVLFESILFNGAALINASGSAMVDEILEAASLRKTIIDTLKTSRNWGMPVSPSVYSIEDNPGAKATLLMESYAMLLDFCKSNAWNRYNYSISDVPVSIDWFYHLKNKLPQDWDKFDFTSSCIEIWRESPTKDIGIRDFQIDGWKLELAVGDLGTGQNGWTRLCRSPY